MKREEEVLTLIRESFELIGIESLKSAIDAYRSTELTYDELIENIMNWNNDFDLKEFLKGYKQMIRGESLKLGNNYYSLRGIVSIGKDKIYDFFKSESVYQIILNPISAMETKLLYSNVVIAEFKDEESRDREYNLILDKLNLLGIRQIK